MKKFFLNYALPILAIITVGFEVMLNLPIEKERLIYYIVIGALFIQIAIYMIQDYLREHTHPKVIITGFGHETMQTSDRYYEWTEKDTGLASGTVQSDSLDITNLPSLINPLFKSQSVGKSFDRYWIWFRNEGDNLKDAEDVHAKIKIYDREKMILEHELPRWVRAPVPNKHQPSININANGKPEGLYLLIREKDTDDFYIFNDESYLMNNFQPIQDRLRLPLKQAVFHIHLSDKNGWHGDFKIKFYVDNNGEPKFLKDKG